MSHIPNSKNKNMTHMLSKQWAAQPGSASNFFCFFCCFFLPMGTYRGAKRPFNLKEGYLAGRAVGKHCEGASERAAEIHHQNEFGNKCR